MSKTAWIVVIGIVVVTLVLGGLGWLASSQGDGYRFWGMMGGRHMMGGFGFPFMGGIAMLLFWTLIIGGVVWLIVAATRTGGQLAPAAPVRESPVDILKRRFAAGEITKEQFDEMKRNLEA